jgi:hypothetical protein
MVQGHELGECPDGPQYIAVNGHYRALCVKVAIYATLVGGCTQWSMGLKLTGQKQVC